MTRKNILSAVGLLSLTALVLATGCGRKLPDLGEVTGQLSLDGKPLDEVQVEFFPDPEKGNPAQSSAAETDQAGQFMLVFTGGGGKRGVPVGWNRVVLQDFKAMNSRDNPIGPRFGPEFSTAFETPIRLEVKQGKQVLNIELRDFRK